MIAAYGWHFFFFTVTTCGTQQGRCQLQLQEDTPASHINATD
eukprot:COSAG01_NODE_66174_length_271_cov_0.593023_1_plen_41_part_01